MAKAVTEKFTNRLQHPWSSEIKEYEDISEAVWISSSQLQAEVPVLTWTAVLDPHHDFAVRFLKIRSKIGDEQTVITTKTKLLTNEKGGILPDEIVRETKSMTFPSNKTFTKLHLTSFEKPDKALFTEEGFRKLGRDYTLADMTSGQMSVGKTILGAPPEALLPLELRDSFGKFPTPIFTMTRIVFMSLGAAMVVFVLFRLWYSQRIRETKE